MGQSKNSGGSGIPLIISTTPDEGENKKESESRIVALSPITSLKLTPLLKKSRSISSLSRVFRNRKWRSKRRGSISASFTVNESEFRIELMNVNKATEEELMTLPGVNRILARNIINHRYLIGGYRRVDDLALVSGMGATKLESIRHEICTNSRRYNRNLSRNSSKTPSMESIPSSSGSSHFYRTKPLLNINTTTIFDLMGVHGINQALAARIINYREKKGAFSQIEDLKKVGISYRRIAALRSYLTVDSSDEAHSSCSNSMSHSHDKYLNENDVSEKNEKHCDDEVDDLEDVYNLLSLKSKRPAQKISFEVEKFKNEPLCRIASWNLESLTEEKISNPGVLEVITQTILENRLSLIAVQEICDREALKKICDELNEPKIKKNREWISRGSWSYHLDTTTLHFNKMSHYLGVLFNTEEIDEVLNVPIPNTFSIRQNSLLWQLSIFNIKVKKTSCMLINVLSTLKASDYSNGHISKNGLDETRTVTELIKSMIKTETGANSGIILGSFNSQNTQNTIGSLEEEYEKIKSSDDASCIYISESLKNYLLQDNCGKIEDGLTHLAIPNGWTFGGRVTKSSPIYMTLSLENKNILLNAKSKENSATLCENESNA